MVQMSKAIKGDGLLDDFYTLLWMKLENFESTQYKFFLPHTILFRNNKPFMWFFSSKNGYVVRKKSVNITFDTIMDAFTSNPSKSGIVGYFIYSKENKDNAKKTENNNETNENNETLCIEYISIDDFKNFLLNPKKSENGVFQQFIDPEGNHNSLIQCIWSPNILLFEKKVNRKNLYDKHLEMYERAATYDGDEVFSEQAYVKGTGISQKLRQSMDDITSHIMKISYEKYFCKRLLIYFKIDQNQNLYFLWCNSSRSSLETTQLQKKRQFLDYFVARSMHNTPLDLNNPPKSEPGTTRKNFSKGSKGVDITKTRQCFRCHLYFCNNQMVDCPFKYIIDTYYFCIAKHELEIVQKEQGLKLNLVNESQFNQGMPKVVNIKIPKDFHQLFPKMSEKDFQQLSENNGFLFQTVQLCEECYIYLVNSQKELSGINPIKYQLPEQIVYDPNFKKKAQKDLFKQPETQISKANKVLKQVEELGDHLYQSENQKESAMKIKHCYSTSLLDNKFKQRLETLYSNSQKKMIQDAFINGVQINNYHEIVDQNNLEQKDNLEQNNFEQKNNFFKISHSKKEKNRKHQMNEIQPILAKYVRPQQQQQPKPELKINLNTLETINEQCNRQNILKQIHSQRSSYSRESMDKMISQSQELNTCNTQRPFTTSQYSFNNSQLNMQSTQSGSTKPGFSQTQTSFSFQNQQQHNSAFIKAEKYIKDSCQFEQQFAKSPYLLRQEKQKTKNSITNKSNNNDDYKQIQNDQKNKYDILKIYQCKKIFQQEDIKKNQQKQNQ